jgi:crotonobetainyl-CoA:carnitine CoA-transferase CaiB-like acyl-CoA transferase
VYTTEPARWPLARPPASRDHAGRGGGLAPATEREEAVAEPGRSGPLEGVRVLDLSRVVTGPVCCFYLACLGAEVIRVEPPGGDPTWTTPPFVGPAGVHYGERGPRDIGISPLRKARGKRSVVLDLKQAAGRDLVRRLACVSDVLVENFRPGVLARLGLDHASLAPQNPRLVSCSITGFGPDGPYRERAGMDLVVQAVSGLMAKTGFPDGPPTKVGVTIGDHVPALFATVGILAALRQRDRDGQGQLVDVAMLDGLLALLWDEPLDEYQDRGRPERVGNGDPRGAPLDTYRTADGWVSIAVVGQAQWERMAAALARPELARRFPSGRSRAEHRDEINAAVAAWCAALPSREVVRRLDAIGVPAGEVQRAWAARTDPQVAHRGALERLRHADLPEPTPFLGPVLPIRLSRAALRAGAAEPLGASTEAVLRGLLGLGEAELRALREGGAFGA